MAVFRGTKEGWDLTLNWIFWGSGVVLVSAYVMAEHRWWIVVGFVLVASVVAGIRQRYELGMKRLV